jgi:AcrR family transcriptional regulator
MSRNASPDRRHPREERSKEAVEDLLEATAQILKQLGVHKTTTEHIAGHLGLSVGSLYQYFPNKIAVYEALMMRHFEQMAKAAVSLGRRLSGATADEFPDLLAAILLTTERNDPKLNGLLHQLAAAHPSVRAVEIEHSRALEMAMATLLEKKRNEPGFRPELDPDITSRVLIRALTGLTRRTMEIDPSFIESDAFASEVQQLIRGYLLAR